MFHVLIADTFPHENIDKLQQLGFQVRYEPKADTTQLASMLAGYQVLMVRSTKVSQQLIEKADSLLLVIRVGSGVNTIDLESCSRQGIFVANCPGKNSIAVAELVFGLLLAIDRKITHAHQSLVEKKWQKGKFSKGGGLHGKSIGLVGFGRIAKEVAARAKAFGMKVFAFNLNQQPGFDEEAKVTFVSNMRELCRASDIISAHIPKTDETIGIFSKSFFEMMNEGAIFINAARGELHDEHALYEAVSSGRISAGIDVFEKESHPFESKLSELENVVLTPHIGASTKQAQLAVADEAIQILVDFQHLGTIRNCVNLQTLPPVKSQLLVRHLNEVGVLAKILNLLQYASINVEGMKNTILEGGRAALASIRLSKVPSTQLLELMKESSEEILQLEVIQLDQEMNK